MGRLLGVDFGEARIGVAVTDALRIMALPVGTFKVGKTMAETAQLLVKELAKYGKFDAIILGLPLLMNGKEGDMVVKVREFGKHLEDAFGIAIIYWDERLTSMQVEKLMIEGGVKRKNRTEHVDSLAAATILQTYLDSIRPL